MEDRTIASLDHLKSAPISDGVHMYFVCKNCNVPVAENASRCSNCGAFLKWAEWNNREVIAKRRARNASVIYALERVAKAAGAVLSVLTPLFLLSVCLGVSVRPVLQAVSIFAIVSTVALLYAFDWVKIEACFKGARSGMLLALLVGALIVGFMAIAGASWKSRGAMASVIGIAAVWSLTYVRGKRYGALRKKGEGILH